MNDIDLVVWPKVKTKKAGKAAKLPHSPTPPRGVGQKQGIEAKATHSPTSKEVKKHASKEVSKPTGKLITTAADPAINKVGYYFTRKEMDQLDQLVVTLKPFLREKHNIKRVTKNDIIRACLIMGNEDWEVNKFTSKLISLLASKLA